jgi:NAD(P)-dependent dehydrogenase (short-subunit alcohol dehydrogenase family)
MSERAAPDLFRLDGRVAVIAGAGSDFGAALARGLAEAGADVALADLSAEGAARAGVPAVTAGRRIHSAGLDATNRSAVVDFVAQTTERLGAPTALVNLIAAPVRKGPSETYDDQAFLAMLDVNVRSHFLFAQAVWSGMQAAGRGAIVNFASTSGIVGQQHQAAYSASKGAVVLLTKTLALDWAPSIRVNAIAPTMFDTLGLRQVREGSPELGLPPMPPDYLDNALARIPLGRLGRVEDMIGPVLFLLSDAAAMVTGTTLMVDGGITAGPYSGPGRP